jgi:hypothetical protein
MPHHIHLIQLETSSRRGLPDESVLYTFRQRLALSESESVPTAQFSEITDSLSLRYLVLPTREDMDAAPVTVL